MNLGRYQIVRELGKGAMGVVYLAKDPIINRLVALKTLRTSILDDEETDGEEFRQRFLREAQTAGILNHPSIVMIHDVGEDKATGISFIAMEFVEGKNLKELVKEGAQLEPDRISDIIAQVAEGLDYAHGKGIIHRDVKPANIILTEGGVAKITDFGIAKIQSSNLTSTGQFLGTPNYMSPEQVSSGEIDHRTDLFSLGVCYYELLTRKKPFAGENLTQISYKIVHEAFVRPREIREELPAGIDKVLDRALAKDPKDRYQRGKEMAADIRRLYPPSRRTVALEASHPHADPPTAAIATPAPGRPAAAKPTPPVPNAGVKPATASGAYKTPTGPVKAPESLTNPASIPLARAPREPASGPVKAAPPKSDSGATPSVATASGSTPRPTGSDIAPPELPARPKGSIWKAQIYTKWVIAIVSAIVLIVLAVVTPLAVHALRGGGEGIDTVWVDQTNQKKQRVVEIERLIAAGNLDQAETQLRQFLIDNPDSVRGRDLQKAIAAGRANALSAGKVRAEVERHLQIGQILYDQGDFEKSLWEWREVLKLDPANLKAKEYQSLAEERIAVAKGKTIEQIRAEGISAKTSVDLIFKSKAIGKGTISIYLGPSQIFRKELNFTKKTGLVAVEETGGEIKATLEIPAGEHEVKVQFVSAERGLDTVQVTKKQQFPVGKIRKLRIELDESGRRLVVSLN